MKKDFQLIDACNLGPAVPVTPAAPVTTVTTLFHKCNQAPAVIKPSSYAQTGAASVIRTDDAVIVKNNKFGSFGF